MKYNSKGCYLDPTKSVIYADKQPDTIFVPSKAEGLTYKWLLDNKINFLYQYQVALIVGNKKSEGIYWKVDFYLPDTDSFVEVKGFKTRDYTLKIRLFKLIYPDTRIDVVENYKQLERIYPQIQLNPSNSLHLIGKYDGIFLGKVA